MNARNLTALSIVTVLVAVAAAMAVSKKSASTSASESRVGQKAFPELAERVNDVVRVTVMFKGGELVFSRTENGWGAADKGGYPVDFDKIKSLVVGLSEAELVNEMTANPELYSKLGVEPVEAEDSSSERVVLADASGKVLADVIVGEAHAAKGAGAPSLYVRPSDGQRALQVTGRLTVDSQVAAWLDKQITKVSRDRVQRVAVTHADGGSLAVTKAKPDDANFAVEDMPEGRELKWAGVANTLAGAFEYLNLEDVLPAEEIDMQGEGATTTEFTTFDGLVLTATLREVDEKTYLALNARYDEQSRYEEATVAPPPADVEGLEGGEEGLEDADPAGAATPDPAGKTPEEVQAEAEKINARVGRWVYVIPGYNASNFTKRMPDLLKELPAAPEVPEVPAPTDDAGALETGDDGAAPLIQADITETPEEVFEEPPAATEEPTEKPVEKPEEKSGGGGGQDPARAA